MASSPNPKKSLVFDQTRGEGVSPRVAPGSQILGKRRPGNLFVVKMGPSVSAIKDAFSNKSGGQFFSPKKRGAGWSETTVFRIFYYATFSKAVSKFLQFSVFIGVVGLLFFVIVRLQKQILLL